MVFSNTTNRNGIIQAIEKKTDLGIGYISGNADRLADFTADINNENHKIWHTIFMSNGNWQYDDGSTTSSMPNGVINLVSGTSIYALPATALTVQRIEAKDVNGLWTVLTPITNELIVNQAIDEFMKTDGSLSYYTLIGNNIELFPAPNYASTGGLKVYFDRGSVDFITSDTIKTPGFASPYHEILAIGTAIEWLKIKQPNSLTLPQLQADYLKMEDAIKKFYGKRFKDYKPKIGRQKENFK